MTVIIKPIDKRELSHDEYFNNYREFDDVESIDDGSYPLIKIRHENHNCYVMMKVPDNCYLLVLNE